MAEVLQKTETTLDSTVPGKQDKNSSKYLIRKKIVLDFLTTDLNPHHLQYHWNKVHHLKKCHFYLKLHPRYMTVRDENNRIVFANTLQVANPCQLQKIKELGKKQTEIQLALLTELLEQLEQGREELSCYVQICDVETFLSQWDLKMKRILKLSSFLHKLISLKDPRMLHVKHSLVPQKYLGSALQPPMHYSLYTKKPPVFDRSESFACQTWAQLKWFSVCQDLHLEHWKVEIKLVTDDSQKEEYCQTQEVISNPCVIDYLRPGMLYEFKVRRFDTQLLVYSQWDDSIILKTLPAEDAKEAPSETAHKTDSLCSMV